ncbi:MAG: TetR/AcrR family transcriptional regulator [Thermoanaerobaculia bacterium]
MVSDPQLPILLAAAEVFSEAGFDGARIDEIARRAGVNKAMLYYRVGNKDELYAAVFGRALAFARTNLSRILTEPGDPETRLRKVCRAIASLAVEMPSLPAIILREISSGGKNIPDALLTEMAGLFASIANLYAEGERAGKFRRVDPVLAHMVTLSGLMLLVSSRGFRERLRGLARVGEEPATVEDLANQFAELLLEGVRIHPGESR